MATTVHLASDLRERLDARAEAPGVGRNRLIVEAVAAALERQGTPVDDFDLALAVEAIAHKAAPATSDFPHFERIPELAGAAFETGGNNE